MTVLSLVLSSKKHDNERRECQKFPKLCDIMTPYRQIFFSVIYWLPIQICFFPKLYKLVLVFTLKNLTCFISLIICKLYNGEPTLLVHCLY